MIKALASSKNPSKNEMSEWTFQQRETSNSTNSDLLSGTTVARARAFTEERAGRSWKQTNTEVGKIFSILGVF